MIFFSRVLFLIHRRELGENQMFGFWLQTPRVRVPSLGVWGPAGPGSCSLRLVTRSATLRQAPRAEFAWQEVDGERKEREVVISMGPQLGGGREPSWGRGG